MVPRNPINETHKRKIKPAVTSLKGNYLTFLFRIACERKDGKVSVKTDRATIVFMKCNRTERKSNSTNSKRQSPKTNKKSVKVDLILWVEQRETSLVLRDCMKLPHGTFFNFFFSWGLYCLHFDLLVLRCSQQQIKTSQQSKAKLLSNQML